VFTHPLVQEYFAAENLLRTLPQEEEARVKSHFLNRVKWTEAIKMMLNLCEDDKCLLHLVNSALSIDSRMAAELAGAIQQGIQETYLQLIRNEDLPPKPKIALIGVTGSVYALPLFDEALSDKIRIPEKQRFVRLPGPACARQPPF